MIIQIMSDIHMEFHTDNGDEFLSNLQPDGVDVLVIAGDLGVGKLIPLALQRLSTMYSNAHVLYVPGNHDYYYSSIPSMLTALLTLENKFDNLVVMNNRLVTIDDVDFIGSTLWFKQQHDYIHYSMALNDFSLIENAHTVFFEENKTAIDFLDWHVSDKSVVITHHVPTNKSTPARYLHDKINMFFTCDMEDFILERKPKLWIHGHTHDSSNYMLGDTHVVCNPLGYLGHEINDSFLINMRMEL